MRSFFFVILTLIAYQAQAISQQKVNHLNTTVTWDPYRIQTFGKLSSDHRLHPQTFSDPSFAAQGQVLNQLREWLFSTDSIQKAVPSQMLQFRSQYEFKGAGANKILENSFWTLENFKRIAAVDFRYEGSQPILRYNVADIATIECQFRQIIVSRQKTQEWSSFENLARALAPDVTQKKFLEKVIVQSCEGFSHLMTHNIQLNFLFKDGPQSHDGVYLVGYNQSYVKMSSMSKLKLAFLWSGVEKGMVDEIFTRFSTLLQNISLLTN